MPPRPLGAPSNRALKKAAAASVEKTNEVIEALESTQNRVAELGNRQAKLEQDQATLETGVARRNGELQASVDAANAKVDRVEKGVKAYADAGNLLTNQCLDRETVERHRQIGELSHRQDRFEQMSFAARVWWLFKGHIS